MRESGRATAFAGWLLTRAQSLALATLQALISEGGDPFFVASDSNKTWVVVIGNIFKEGVDPRQEAPGMRAQRIANARIRSARTIRTRPL